MPEFILPQKYKQLFNEYDLSVIKADHYVTEREDLRVVHACWNAEAIEAVRHESDVLRCYERHRVRIESALSAGSTVSTR